MADFINQFKQMFQELSLARKLSMAIILVGALVVIGYFVHVSNQAKYEPLFTNLNSQDMGTILTQLDNKGISYEVNQEHRTIMVPASEVLSVRMEMASQGLPRFGGIGFELFDQGSFGMSEFEQRVNYQRAMEGELSRTIGSLKEIEMARVHLVLPEKTLFAEAQQAASASVIIKLGSGDGSLSNEKVKGITHLVASAVDALEPDQVTVVDTAGRLLTTASGQDGSTAGNQIFDQKMQIEKSFEKRIVELLSPVVGMNKVLARVTVDVDFTRTNSTEELVDPTRVAVVNESRTTAKKSQSGSGSGGVAGAAANLPGGSSGSTSSGSGGSSDEGTESVSYAISKTIRHETKPMGAIKKMSIAILVDGNYEEKDGEQISILVDGNYEEKDGEQIYQPRSADEIKKIEDLVKNATGFLTDRGDQLKVENMAFLKPEKQFDMAQAWYEQKTTYGFLTKVIGNVLILLVIFMVFFFVIRPIIKSWNGGELATGQAGSVGALLEGESRPDLAQLVEHDPVAAANAIRAWLK